MAANTLPDPTTSLGGAGPKLVLYLQCLFPVYPECDQAYQDSKTESAALTSDLNADLDACSLKTTSTEYNVCIADANTKYNVASAPA